ncbi:uncharacterized protein L201_008073 [Kwoniella dendrophila CBS 6074]|uniref:Peptidyl-prolyl cis-trans isomerase n=1 Tax=Kwoniella dendrophila CBS 6074 TaxID=1295534 RepID=A0AAX4K647_9TREE
MSDKLPNVFFVVAINGKEIGKIEFKLYDDITPKTSANFRSLCIGKKPDGTCLPKGFGYKGTLFHRVIPEFMIQGGDFERGDGTGGISIYGDKFPDENFEKKHDKSGLLSCANAGPNSNGSQFFITTATSCPWLDGKHTVFGEVANESSMKVVKEIESKGNKEGKMPKDKIVIIDCGAI